MTLTPLPTPETHSNDASQSSGPVLRQYTSPTCTLEISANPSPLEKWTRKPTLKNQRFLLKFEDPRLSEDQWVSFRGDRLKLAALTETVTTYVQGFLSQSRTLNPTELGTELTHTELALPPSAQGITLQPKGLLAHTLKLGTIDSSSPDSSLTLTSTQLSDLASVLDEHNSATLDLPTLNRDTAWMRSPMAWGKIAALSLLSVGITANVLNQFSPKKAPTQIASQASSSDQRLTPPQLPPTTPSPSTTIASSKLPTTQLPSIGSSTPPIVADSNPNTATNPQEAAKSDPSKANNPPAKTPEKTVESTENSQQNKDSNQRREIAGKLPAKIVQSVPVAGAPQPLDARARKPISADEAAEPQPPEPDWAAQLKGIQSKISNKWTPPEKFSEELTYTIEIAPNGTVQSVSPDGKSLPAAQTVLPAIGSPIAPPLPPGNTNPYQVRVFFSPDGTVNTKISVKG
jgi:Domain of unknown function (DUF4335)